MPSEMVSSAGAIGIRISALIAKLKIGDLDALLITKPENRSYISGFTGSSAFIIAGQDKPYLVTDFRYVEQAHSQSPGYTVVRHEQAASDAIRDVATAAGYRRIGFEKDHLTFALHQTLCEKLTGVELVPTEGLVEGLRAIKDQSEIALMRRAAAIADAAFLKVLAIAKTGMTETDLAVELEFQMRRAGSAKVPFDIIVASGPRSSLPHGRASDRVIGEGDFVTVDWGATYAEYCSDCTRTVVFGRADDRQREIYSIVQEAQRTALDAIRAGLKGMEADAMARDLITARGFGEYFGHGLGHGVGRAVHELPGVGIRSEGILEPGHVVTVEPGIYIPDWGGVRIEDLVVITPQGREVLTSVTKELLVL
jgi:Xaa-Pro aminopeptidase